MAFNGGYIGGGNITSANAIFALTCQDVFNAGAITLENWSADHGIEAENQEITELKMSIDGRLNAGYIPRATEMTLTFSAASNSIPVFEAITAYQQQSRGPVELNAEITIPSISRKYTLTRGFIKDVSVIPNTGTTLEDRAYHITWNAVEGAGL